MNLNEIKKLLYKQKPDAIFHNASKEGLLYSAEISTGETTSSYIQFLVPLDELGDTRFYTKVPSQLLIRYIQTDEGLDHLTYCK